MPNTLIVIVSFYYVNFFNIILDINTNKIKHYREDSNKEFINSW